MNIKKSSDEEKSAMKAYKKPKLSKFPTEEIGLSLAAYHSGHANCKCTYFE